ncbi:hypothetical protein MML48_8g00000852 [Holotrichia oblita]|uniref:Uncharacterized protein n=1 Tax=Holotrichia oblita TaxID=644536 RepID=A0ACB9SNA6_HOLOL|nr:hypothetical protein MML48_8g00000852 [Holotrichia oblita]
MTEETKEIPETTTEVVEESPTKIEDQPVEKKIENVTNDKKCDNNLTISTKLSTDQLICKSPQNSPNLSDRSSPKARQRIEPRCTKPFRLRCLNLTLYLGILQILFGMLMSVFGVLAIIHGSNLSQIGGGLWGGCLAVATGTTGVLTAARDCCPLKRTPQRIAHTVFLALSLISLAVSQLVMVLSATGLSRDLEKTNSNNVFESETTTTPANANVPSQDYSPALANIGVLVASALECICAAVASYKGARAICPCFHTDEEQLKYDYPSSNPKHAFVNSWLGKHNPPSFYVVAAPPSIGRHSKISSNLPITPIYTLPPPPTSVIGPPSLISYSMIPGPLGPLPSPATKPRIFREYLHAPIPKSQKEKPAATAYKKRQRSRSRSRSKSKERCVTTEEVAKTYTGLDRTIAEEFIDMCESRNNSLCSSETSCQSCCQCSSQATCQLCSSNSEANSREYLVDNK